jgi:hypothetical protein
MNTQPKTNRGLSGKNSLGGKPLEINVLSSKGDIARFNELAGKFHYMGEGRPAGDTLRMAVVCEGEWVALFLWGSAAYRLKDRDEFIGWNNAQRAARQKLVVQNRRFVILSEPGANPNLASKVLGLAIRSLPALWRERFGYEPLLAETFCDIEAREGTCYKASGWTPLGMTKGYSRHRADFYVPNDRPKKLWVRELRPDAAALLRAPQLPAECLKGAHSDADGAMPIGIGQIETLHEFLCRVPDPRAGNSKYRIGAMLSILAMAVFSGHRHLAQVVRFADRMHMNHRKALALPRRKGGQYRDVPSYTAFYNLLGKLDVDAFAKVLTEWLQQYSGTLPRALALDGKYIRDIVGIVCLADHETGVPHAMTGSSQKEGAGDRCELKAGQKLVEAEDRLDNTIITADALHCQRDFVRSVVERGGEVLVQAKDNQKTVRANTEARLENTAPLLPGRKKGTVASTRAPSA